MGPGDLHEMLGGMEACERDPRVLVDMSTSDDAGVVDVGALAEERRVAAKGRLAGVLGLIHTIDVITPIVDDPRTFGRVAAANSVSDVYAMGGEPTSAVAFLGVPKELPKRAVAPIMEGAREVLEAAGAPLLGGHTVKDKELKLGFAVTGFVDPAAMTTVDNARAGQRLILTKALGTGVLYQANKQGLRTRSETRALIASLTTLNKLGRDVMVRHGVRCATDVTGFGLIGHALNIARASGVDLVLFGDRIPALPGVLGYLEKEIFPGTTGANLSGYGADLVRGPGVSEAVVRLGADPQTSGGLLIAAEPDVAPAILEALGAVEVGEVRAKRGRRGRVRVVATSDDLTGPGPAARKRPRSERAASRS